MRHRWLSSALYVARTLASLLVSLFIASIIIFVLLRLLPGDSAGASLGVGATQDQLEQLRHELGTDQPILTQYTQWLHDLLTGTSQSFVSRQTFGELVSHRLTITVPLSVLAFILAVLISTPLGIIAATRRKSASGLIVSGASQLGLAVPVFWVGIILVWIFALTLGWLPAGNFPRQGWDNPEAALRALILPITTIAIAMSATMVRFIRSAIIDVLDADYMRTARSLGYSRTTALLRHGLRNAAVPVIAIFGIELGTSLLGAVVIENVFALPGLGQLLLTSVSARDLPVIQNLVMLLTAVVLVLNTIVDLIQRALDPRLRGGAA
ncbi:ABC transporter permease [Arcanobacterium haemolyticum]|nr:ABC transporter permease [Arcanobacterium haemolyticum]